MKYLLGSLTRDVTDNFIELEFMYYCDRTSQYITLYVIIAISLCINNSAKGCLECSVFFFFKFQEFMCCKPIRYSAYWSMES